MAHEMEMEEVTPAVSTGASINHRNQESKRLLDWANRLFSAAGEAFRSGDQSAADRLINQSLKIRRTAVDLAA